VPEPAKTKSTKYRVWVRSPEYPEGRMMRFGTPGRDAPPAEYERKSDAYSEIAFTRRRVRPVDAVSYGIQEVRTTVRTSAVEWEDDTHEPKNDSAAIAAAYTESHDA
jgi:hypothetical protein